MSRITRRKSLEDGREVVVERSALGQVIEYDVYVIDGEKREHKGGGSKREAQRIFDSVKS